eukprot:4777731-Amphidinium_carterae.1
MHESEEIWRRFTPKDDEISHSLCLARTWNEVGWVVLAGRGGQCTKRPSEAGSSLCATHQKHAAHGLVTGPIPTEKLDEFLRQNKELRVHPHDEGTRKRHRDRRRDAERVVRQRVLQVQRCLAADGTCVDEGQAVGMKTWTAAEIWSAVDRIVELEQISRSTTKHSMVSHPDGAWFHAARRAIPAARNPGGVEVTLGSKAPSHLRGGVETWCKNLLLQISEGVLEQEVPDQDIDGEPLPRCVRLLDVHAWLETKMQQMGQGKLSSRAVKLLESTLDECVSSLGVKRAGEDTAWACRTDTLHASANYAKQMHVHNKSMALFHMLAMSQHVGTCRYFNTDEYMEPLMKRIAEQICDKVLRRAA